MLIALPVIITLSLTRFLLIDPSVDNTKTLYCVADSSIKVKSESEVTSKRPCVRGSMSVNKDLPSLAERKSK